MAKCEYPLCKEESGSRRYCRRICNAKHVIQKRRKARKRELVEMLGGKCVQCGYKNCIDALQFHHLGDSKKDGSVGKMIANNVDMDLLIAEAKKCEILCANCHAEAHSKCQQGNVAEWLKASFC